MKILIFCLFFIFNSFCYGQNITNDSNVDNANFIYQNSSKDKNYNNENDNINIDNKITELLQITKKTNDNLEDYKNEFIKIYKKLDENVDLLQRILSFYKNNSYISNGNTNDNLQQIPAKKDDNNFIKERQQYQSAVDLLSKNKQLSENKFRNYLLEYPQGIYISNVHYWLGEIKYSLKHFSTAEEEFKIIVNNYRESKRYPDALLKLALIHQYQGKSILAKIELQQLIAAHPWTTASQLAKQQLATLD